MEERLDRIMDELAERYAVSPAFLVRVRPLAARIFAPGTPERARPDLLTLLAETCARQARTERNCERARRGLERFFADLERLLREVLQGGQRPATEG